jgi:hypothetical protein
MVPPSASAQELDCTYANCALRMQRSFWHTRVVAGESGRQVARVGFLGTNLDERITLPDSALRFVHAANAGFRRGAVLNVLGLVSLVGLAVTNDESTIQVVAPLAVLGFTFAGALVMSHAYNDLERGIWWYNGQWAR